MDPVRNSPINIETLKEIIRLGTYAPSGDNSQPWRFVVRGNKVDIFNLPEKDNPYYNFRQNGSMVAHGGLIENMVIVSEHLGYRVDIQLLPRSEESNLVATLSFYESTSRSDPLYSSVVERTTNRKPYDKVAVLTDKEREELVRVGQEIGTGEIKLVEDKEMMKIVGEASSVNEIVALETKKLHNIFFNDIVWSEEEEKEKRSGLFIKTLELPLPVELLFRLLKRWPIANALNHIGFAKLAARGNAQLYSSASAMGVVVVPENKQRDYINAGRLMERVWLKATKMDLSLQPVTGILFLGQRVLADQAQELSPKHIGVIREAYKKLENVFNVKKGTMAMLFRVGHGGKPNYRSSRLLPNIETISI